MSFFIAILTFLVLINCAVLVLLILVQLPKKDAGAGLAFGGGTADALFGAGSGNALTKITKWAAGIFIGLTVILSLCEGRIHTGNQSLFEQGVEQQQQQMQTSPQVAPQTPPPASQGASHASSPSMPLFSATNAPAPATTTGK
jgi:protein translocase SecG subunit